MNELKKKLLIIEVLSRGSNFHYRYDLFRSKGYQLFYLTTSQQVDYSFDSIEISPSRQIDDLLEIAKNWHTKECFDTVITTDEASIIATAIIAKHLELPGLSIEAAQCSRNKLFMREAHKRNGAPHPEFQRCDSLEIALDFAERIGYPVVIKPTLGGDSEHIYRVDNKEELQCRFIEAMIGNSSHSHRFAEAECPEIGPHTLLLEAYLDGPEHCVEAIIDGEQIFIGSIADRISVEMPIFDNDLYRTPTTLSSNEIDLISSAIFLGAKAQGIKRGVLHAELRFHGDKPYIIEIAARPGGGSLQHMAKISYGYCSISAALNVAENIRLIDIPKLKPTGCIAVGLTMLCAEGHLKNIYVPDQLLSNSNVFNFQILPKPGAKIRRPPNGNDIFAYIGTSSDTLNSALDLAENIANKIKVTFYDPSD